MNKIIAFNLLIVFSLLFYVTSVHAETIYSLEYATNSPIKSIPLHNAELKLKIYEYEKPHGFVRVITNKNGEFSLESNHDFAIEEIIGEEKYNALCSGDVTRNQKKIQITCVPR